MENVVNVQEVLDTINAYWSQKTLGIVNDVAVKVAKLKGEFEWHKHDQEDELFYVLNGSLKLEMEDSEVIVNEGELFVMPAGVKHHPVCESECWVLLIEKEATKQHGD